MTRSTTSTAGFAAVVVAVHAFLLIACTDDDEPTEPTEPTEEERACADWEQLQGAIEDLKAVDVVADGTDALRSATDDVSEALGELRVTAGATLDEEVGALGTAVDSLVDEVAALPSGSGQAGEGLVTLGGAIQAVDTAASDLAAQLDEPCQT